MNAAMRGWLAGAAAVLLLAGCERTPTGASESGALRFTFSGDTAGAFDASGPVSRTNLQSGTYAVGALQMVPQGQYLSVVGQRARASDPGLLDLTMIAVLQPSIGTFDCTTGAIVCPFDILYVTGARATDSQAEAFFLGRRGTMTITSIVGRRAVGTFTVELEELVEEGSGRRMEASGSFDVPLRSERTL